MSITAKSLKEILQVFKDFDITDVKFKTGELELECRFVNSKTTQPNKVPKTPLFPEAKYSNAIQSFHLNYAMQSSIFKSMTLIIYFYLTF